MYNGVRFEWDAAKNRANQKKHGIDFETAVQVFNNPNHLLIEDRMDDAGERRWHVIGLSGDVPLLVVHVYRSTHDEKEIIRIISARKASQRESRRYFE